MLGDRSLFSDLESRVYFNHAAMSPPSRPVREAIGAALESYARRGVAAWPEWLEQRDRLRGRLAALLGAEAADIALVPNTSAGVLDIAWSIRWQPGDRILVFTGDFPSNVTPWQRVAHRFGLEIGFLDRADLRGESGLARIEEEIARGCRLLAVSAVEFQTGFRSPLRRLGAAVHAAGGELFVDGIQAVGSVPLDVRAEGIDYLAAGGHKWLMGVEGTGMLYVAAAARERLEPAFVSWLSHEEGARFLFGEAGQLRHDRPLRRDAAVFEGGVNNSIGYAGLEAAVALLQRVGVANLYRHVQDILDRIEAAFVERGFASARAADPAQRSCILSLTPPSGIGLAALQHALAEQGIATATPDGYLRISPHWPNDPGQVRDVITVLDVVLVELQA